MQAFEAERADSLTHGSIVSVLVIAPAMLGSGIRALLLETPGVIVRHFAGPAVAPGDLIPASASGGRVVVLIAPQGRLDRLDAVLSAAAAACRDGRLFTMDSVDPVVVALVSDSDREAEILHAAAAGVRVFLDAEADAEHLRFGVEAAARDIFFCSPRLARWVLPATSSGAQGGATPEFSRDIVRDESFAALWATLTARERAVAERVAQGDSNAEAAAALFLSPDTVKSHLKAVFEKLGIHRRSQLASRLTGHPLR